MEPRLYLTDPSAAAPAFRHWREQAPGAPVLALVAEASKDFVAPLQQLAAEEGIRLFGAIFPELLREGRFQREGAWLLRLPDGARAELLQASGPEADAEALETFATREGGPQESDGLFLILDAMVPHATSLLAALYQRLSDGVSYSGVNAGSETFQPMPCLFDGHQCVGDALLAVLLPDTPGALLHHGYRASSIDHIATSAEGNRITSINWRPAFEVYQGLVQAHYEQAITRENFYQFGVHFPFGILRANGEIIVRIPVALQEDGSLYCTGEVPGNAVLTVLEGPEAALAQAAIDQGEEVRRQGWNASLLFYCAGRRMHLGVPAAEKELKLMETYLGPPVGALSLGEIGTQQGGDYPLFHNGTLVCLRMEPR